MKEVVDQIENPRDLETLLEERKKANEERKAASANKRVKLSLVNTEEFEDWLAVANIVSRSERVYEKYLEELRSRMGRMVDSWGHAEANPLGVSVFSHSFDDAIRTVELSKEVRQKVYTGFESKVIPLFRKFYITTTKLLEDSGLFPDLDDDYVSPDKPEPATVEADSESIEDENEVEEEQVEEEEVEEASQQAEAEEQEEEEEEAEEVKSLEHELKEELRRRREERKAQRGARGAQRGIPRPARGQVQREDTPRPQVMRDDSDARQMRQRPTTQHQPTRDVGEAISNTYGTVRELMQDDYYEYDDAHVEIDEVVGLLQQLQSSRRETGSRIPVRQQLMDQSVVDGRIRRLAPRQRRVLRSLKAWSIPLKEMNCSRKESRIGSGIRS